MSAYTIDMRGKTTLDPRMAQAIQRSSPKTAEAVKIGLDFEERVLSKWEYYQKNYGYKKTKVSAKAASVEISKELLKSFPKSVNGIRINDADAVYKIIEPVEINWPWFLNWKFLLAGAAVVYLGPGMLRRYRK